VWHQRRKSEVPDKSLARPPPGPAERVDHLDAVEAAEVPVARVGLVIVNQGETSLDDLADAKLQGPIGEVLPRLVPAGDGG
jgi:hypothetical protein